ncbi:hypothetical protein PG989_012410 [Apiospora arundinis]|uniref:Efflux pump n=1 Tax=Apiospora arundinis TaxID=335852 RepID=A0ABR2IIE4_9PEZI
MMGNLWSSDNPNGLVFLGVAENPLLRQELATHIMDHFTIDPNDHLGYGVGPRGSPRLKRALAAFFNLHFQAREPVLENELLILSGVTAVIDALAWSICNDGEGIIVPQPFYTGFKPAVGERARGVLTPASFQSIRGYQSLDDIFDPAMNVEAFENALRQATKDDVRVRAVLLSNPHNPLGRCYPAETLKEIASFCGRNGLHLICDEVFAKSVYENARESESVPFTSILALDLVGCIDPQLVHVAYGMGKDFCANGLRLGVLHSRNAGLVKAISSISVFGWVPYVTQGMWTNILDDESFLTNFFAKNQTALAGNCAILTSFLEQNKIPYYSNVNAGVFVWVDLRYYLRRGLPAGTKATDLFIVMTIAKSSDGTSLSKAPVLADQDATKLHHPPEAKEENPLPNREYVTGVKLGVIVAAVAFASFLMLLDTMIISTAIPRITDEFHSLVDVGWYASAYQFGSAAPQPLTGRIYKYFNTKWTFLAFFAVFELGSVLCGAAVSSPMFIIGRFVAGFGAAGISTGSITIVSCCAPLEKRPALIGLTMGFNLLGLVVGPLVGGAFTSYTTWRWCFYVNLPAGGLAALAILLLHIPEEEVKPKASTLLPRLHHHLDLIGFVLFAPAVLMLLLALQFGGQAYPWKSSQVIGLFCGAGATAIVWFFWNRHRGDEAMMPHSMISRRDVLASGIYEAFLMSAVFGAVYYLPLYFQAVNGASAMLSAVYLLPMILAQLFVAGAAGGLVSKIGFVIPIAVFSTVFLSIGTGLYSILQPASPTGYWVGFQILAGIGSGAGLQLAIIAVQAAMGDAELSSGVAFIIFTQALGPTITLTLFNIIFLTSLQSQIIQHAPQVDPAIVVGAGATGFRSVVPPADLPAVLVAYANSLNHVFYLAAALAAACGIFLWGMGWHDLRQKNGDEQGKSKIGDPDAGQSTDDKGVVATTT